MFIFALVSVGLAAGMMSGLVGIGGGVLIVPALVLMLGFSQRMAQGTTLALLIPPIGIAAAWAYWRAGDVDVKAAAFIIAGFLAGSLAGALLATRVSNEVLARVFAVFLVLVAAKLFIKPT